MTELSQLKKLGSQAVYIIVFKFVEDDREKLIQQALKNLGHNIMIDGILGTRSINAIISTQPDKFINEVYKLMEIVEVTGDKHIVKTAKEYIMGYLAKAEGSVFHYNSTEHGFTTPFGVYAYVWKKAPVIAYSKSLYAKYELNPDKKEDARKLNRFLTKEERTKVRDMVYDFYVKNFMDEDVNEIMEKNGLKKSALTFFSNSVNGGLRTGKKMLQKGIGVTADGAIGNGTLSALSQITSDNELNTNQLGHMRNYYLGLVRNNPAKFGKYKRGWFARLVDLARDR